MNKQILQYINEMLKAGQSLENAKKNLIASGWPTNEIDEAMKKAKIPDPVRFKVGKRSKAPFILVILLLIIGAIASGAYLAYPYFIPYIQKVINPQSAKTSNSIADNDKKSTAGGNSQTASGWVSYIFAPA